MTGRAIYTASLGARSDVTYAPGWTAVVPVHLNADLDTDLLFYNRSTGAVTLTVARGPAIQEHLADTNVGRGFTAIVPLNINGDHLTDWLRYDESTGTAIYTVNLGNGSKKDVRTVQGPKGQTLFAPMMNSRNRATRFIATFGGQ